jgi:alpha/beta superfamily hydrolase
LITPPLNIPAPAGSLEGWLTLPEQPGSTAAVLCHPHPLYGGSMHDAVLEQLASALLAAGVACLRFNFRGVGDSTGRHDGGVGEVDDLRAAIRWLADNHAPDELWIGGYSFGAHVCWQLLAAGDSAPAPRRAILIAPPVGRMPFDDCTPSCPVVAIAGDSDSFVDTRRFRAWPGVSKTVIEGADHFFSGASRPLRAALENAVDAAPAAN